MYIPKQYEHILPIFSISHRNTCSQYLGQQRKDAESIHHLEEIYIIYSIIAVFWYIFHGNSTYASPLIECAILQQRVQYQNQ